MCASPDPAVFTSIRPADLVGIAEAQIQAAILNGHLSPGARIVEADLARRMGISRAPVREAARRLESAGLLTSQPRRGFFVRQVSARQAEELYQVRIDLELMAGRLACASASDAQIARLNEKVEHMVAQAALLNRAERVALDLDLHAYIAEISGNSYLHRLFCNLQTEVRMFQSLCEPGYEDPHYIAESHRPIAAAITRRDAQATQAALRLHLQAALEQAREYVRRTQDNTAPDSSGG